MEAELRSPRDARGIDADVMGIAQRFDVDNLEHLADRPSQREIDRLPLHRRAEVADVERAAGNLDRLDGSSGGRELEPVVCERSGAADFSRRGEPAKVVYR